MFGGAQFVSAFLAPASSPLVAAGAWFIDITPAWLKDLAIGLFGTADKLALGVSIGIMALIGSAAIGIVSRRWLRAGLLMVALIGAALMAAVGTRAGTNTVDLLPTAAGTVLGLAALRWLTTRAARTGATHAGEVRTRPAADRRSFLRAAVLGAAGAVVLGAGSRVVEAVRGGVRQVREAIRLPAPTRPAAPLPSGVQAPVAGMPAYTTPNAQFYRIDTALVVPEVDPGSWRLRVHGMVEQEVELSYAELMESGLVEADVTLTCVSNAVGGDLAGNARWLGLPLRQVLERARPLPGADMVLSTSADGFSASTPLEVLRDGRNALLAVGMNGEPLPLEHGFPVRMVVPGLYGFVSATKWVVDLEVTRFADKQAYWTARGWDERAPIKLASRVDVPRGFARLPAGTVDIGGTAWAQGIGISRVEVQLDGGDWREAVLAAEATVDSWRQWSYRWEDAEPGDHTARVRAYDATGAQQTGERADPIPNGASGWHEVRFTVG
ncbi:molybdopterin-dependent oxidoreductase [Zafaria cholistanensis]